MTEKQMRIEQMKALGRYNKELAAERKKLTAEHEDYLKRDIIEIYSAMAVVLHDNGNSQEDILELIGQIQMEWTHHVTVRAPKTGQTMAQYCIEHTGVDIEQRVE